MNPFGDGVMTLNQNSGLIEILGLISLNFTVTELHLPPPPTAYTRLHIHTEQTALILPSVGQHGQHHIVF